jgi:hypothetical protein
MMRIVVETPDGHHLNSLAPSRLALATSNAAVIEPGETELQWSTDEAEVNLTVPVNLREGAAVLTATGQAYYCRDGEEALCFIQDVEITLPVTVTSAATASEVILTVSLPQGG